MTILDRPDAAAPMSAASGLRRIFEETAFLYGGNAAYLEALQDRFEADPQAVPESWRDVFRWFGDDPPTVRRFVTGPPWRPRGDGLCGPAEPVGVVPEAEALRGARASARALAMIHAYRVRGHLLADLDPLGLRPRKDHADLRPATYGFADADADDVVFLDGALGRERATLGEILAILRRTYCGVIGYEFMHISDPERKAWLQARVEGPEAQAPFPPEARRDILQTLVEVKGYERYLDKKFVGTKRFGLDGAESAIPALDAILATAAAAGVAEVVVGMAHRGRLNVLSQVLKKPHRAIFHEFQGGSSVPDEVEGSGDVKYHLGASSDRMFGDRKIHLSLTANPSHLEIVDPVCLGKVRAKQDQAGDREARASAMALLIHGDAAFAGQGVVAECFGLSGLAGHTTGGSIHLIINNQIGFTTDPAEARSSPYPSDLAKMVEAPIFHVNGDDPEAVVRAARLAVEFRQRFHTPAVIDMFCFRLYGHNEGDEPAFTQPLMYRAIRAHPSTLEIYRDRLVAEGLVTSDDVDRASADWTAFLDAELEASKTYAPDHADWLDARWSGLTAGSGGEDRRARTAVDVARLRAVGARLTTLPQGLRLHPTVQRFVDHRRAALESGVGIDWSTAEALAFGSLVDEGVPVRLAGQDSERGTFTQRHAVLSDQETGARYTPLTQIRDGQARCEIVNSMLSEEAVLGFEYGYSLAEPDALVLWEAQFGDFANGAQVVFDQFLSAGERKWLRMSGLVCLLPHGYDGQGPEHSSARLERYLQNSAEDNWQVANCTTPANYFHILRRQVKGDVRKPLILMTPKSLLRHKRAVSTLADMGPGSGFQPLLADDGSRAGASLALAADGAIRRVILCSGKVYYDLYEAREKRGAWDVYLLRIEQLYPFPLKALAGALGRFPAADLVWCQEEPRNMGAWTFVEPLIRRALAHAPGAVREAAYAGRPAAASTAVGAMPLHLAQLETLLQDAFRA